MHKQTILISMAVLFGAVACTKNVIESTPGIYSESRFSDCKTWSKQDPAEFQTVSVLSPELSKIIGVRSVVSGRTGSGLANTQVTLYNCTDVDIVLQARARFMGTAGQSEPPSMWKTLHLPPRGQMTFSENAVALSTQTLAVDVYDANRGQSQFAPGQTYENKKWVWEK